MNKLSNDQLKERANAISARTKKPHFYLSFYPSTIGSVWAVSNMVVVSLAFRRQGMNKFLNQDLWLHAHIIKETLNAKIQRQRYRDRSFKNVYERVNFISERTRKPHLYLNEKGHWSVSNSITVPTHPGHRYTSYEYLNDEWWTLAHNFTRYLHGLNKRRLRLCKR